MVSFLEYCLVATLRENLGIVCPGVRLHIPNEYGLNLPISNSVSLNK